MIRQDYSDYVSLLYRNIKFWELIGEFLIKKLNGIIFLSINKYYYYYGIRYFIVFDPSYFVSLQMNPDKTNEKPPFKYISTWQLVSSPRFDVGSRVSVIRQRVPAHRGPFNGHQGAAFVILISNVHSLHTDANHPILASHSVRAKRASTTETTDP